MTPDNAIGFGTYLGTNTKATAEIGFEVGDVMSVMAYATGADDFVASGATITSFMTNVDVTKGTGTPVWSYSPLKYWPKNTSDKISFFAVSDASTTARDFAALNSDSKANFNYDNPATATAQVDLMAASKLNLKSDSGEVDFTFKHILSQILFTFKTGADYDTSATITLTDVTVDFADDFSNKGTFSFSKSVDSEGAWALDTDSANKQGDVVVSSLTKTLSYSTAVADAVDPIMIIPQDKEMKLTVSYTVQQDDSTFSETFTSESLTPAPDAPAVAGFLQNTIYTYPVTISLDAIVFGEPTINAWPTPSTDSAVGIN